MFNTYFKKQQSNYFANTWKLALQNKEVMKNNYRANGDIKKAKVFVSLVSQFRMQLSQKRANEILIFSYEALPVPLLNYPLS